MSKKPTTKPDALRTVAHLTETAGEHLSHAQRHVSTLLGQRGKSERAFNADHATKHLGEAVKHLRKLNTVVTHHPAVKAELSKLGRAKRSVVPG